MVFLFPMVCSPHINPQGIAESSSLELSEAWQLSQPPREEVLSALQGLAAEVARGTRLRLLCAMAWRDRVGMCSWGWEKVGGSFDGLKFREV
jgi:hypothetical protein